MDVDLSVLLPVSDCRQTGTVLAATLSRFGPTDPVRLFVSADDGSVPTADQQRLFACLLTELQSTLGPLPHTSICATAEVPLDATVLAAPPRPGGSELALARAEAIVAARWRNMHRSSEGPIRVAVVLWVPNLWSVVASFVAAAQAHPDIQLELCCPDGTDNAFADFFAAHGVQTHDEIWLVEHLDEFDVVVMPDPYDEQRPAGLRSQDLAAAGARLVYIPYAQSLSGQPENLSRLHNLILHNIAWRIYVANESQVEHYSTYCEVGSRHVRTLGSTKNEYLLTARTAARDAKRIRTTLGTKTVTLWNPHWSMGERGWSTFPQNLSTVVAHFVQNPRQGLILRPHPGLLSAMNLLGGDGGGARISVFRAMCEDIPNVYLDESYDHVPALLAADAMISDLSSMIGEYLCLNRPLGFLKPSSGIELNCDQSWLSNVTTIETEQQLQTFLAHPSRPAGAHTPKRDLGSAARIVTAMVADYRQETASPDAVAA